MTASRVCSLLGSRESERAGESFISPAAYIASICAVGVCWLVICGDDGSSASDRQHALRRRAARRGTKLYQRRERLAERIGSGEALRAQATLLRVRDVLTAARLSTTTHSSSHSASPQYTQHRCQRRVSRPAAPHRIARLSPCASPEPRRRLQYSHRHAQRHAHAHARKSDTGA